MTLPEVISFFVALLPFLNAGIMLLIVDLFLRRFGLEVATREFKRAPWKSLFLGLCLIFISNSLYLSIQGALSQITELGVFLVLLLAYGIIVTTISIKRRKRR